MSLHPFNTDETKTSSWPLGFESSNIARYAWQKTVDDELSIDEQIKLGVRICVEKHKNSRTLADTLRNSHEPSRYVLETPFRKLFQKTVKELIQKLEKLDEDNEESKEKKQEEIINQIKDNIPTTFIEQMAYFYKAHIEKKIQSDNDENQSDSIEKKKIEFARLIMFQFVQAAILNEVKDDSKKSIALSQQLKSLSKHESYNEIIEALVQKLDENANRLSSLPEISTDESHKFEEYLAYSKRQQGVIMDSHNRVKSEIEGQFDHVSTFLKGALLDNDEYPFLYEMREEIKKNLDTAQNSYDSEVLRQCRKASHESEHKFYDKAIVVSIQRENTDLVKKCIDKGANIGQKTRDYDRGFFQRIKDVFTIKGGVKNFFTKPERTLVEIAELSGNKEIKKEIQEAQNNFLKRGEVKTNIVENKVIDLDHAVETEKHFKSSGLNKQKSERKKLMFNFDKKESKIASDENPKPSTPLPFDPKDQPSNTNKKIKK